MNVPIKMNEIDEIWMNRVNRTIRGEMSELKEMTWNNPMGISLWVENECPYQNDLIDLSENVPIKMIRIDEIWMNWSEMRWNEVKWVIWRKWARTTLWEWSYGQKKVSLSKWLDLFVVTKSFQNDQNRWEMSELSEMKWNEWFEGFDFVNPMARSLWSSEGEPYESDLSEPNGKVPIKMIRIDEIWMNWGE